MNEYQTQLNLYRTLGNTLGIKAQQILKAAFKIKYREVDYRLMTNIVYYATGIKPVLNDRKYWLTDWETWKQLIKYDWTDKKKYVVDRYDCDDFSKSFNARMPEIYDLNSVGRFSNTMIYPDKTEVPHRASMIVASDNSVYAFEPQTDNWVKVEKGKDIIIDNRKYIPRYISF